MKFYHCECGLVTLTWKPEEEDKKCPQCDTSCTVERIM